jgi:hypothetical protein
VSDEQLDEFIEAAEARGRPFDGVEIGMQLARVRARYGVVAPGKRTTNENPPTLHYDPEITFAKKLVKLCERFDQVVELLSIDGGWKIVLKRKVKAKPKALPPQALPPPVPLVAAE